MTHLKCVFWPTDDRPGWGPPCSCGVNSLLSKSVSKLFFPYFRQIRPTHQISCAVLSKADSGRFWSLVFVLLLEKSGKSITDLKLLLAKTTVFSACWTQAWHLQHFPSVFLMAHYHPRDSQQTSCISGLAVVQLLNGCLCSYWMDLICKGATRQLLSEGVRLLWSSKHSSLRANIDFEVGQKGTYIVEKTSRHLLPLGSG